MAKVDEDKFCSPDVYDENMQDCKDCADADACKEYWEKQAGKREAIAPEITKEKQVKVDHSNAGLHQLYVNMVSHFDKCFNELSKDIMIALDGINVPPASNIEMKEATFKDEMDVSPEQAEDMVPPDSKPETPDDSEEDPDNTRADETPDPRLQEQNEMLLLERSVPDKIFKLTFSEMMAEFAELWNDGYEVDDGKIVKGEACFRLFQEDTKSYQLGSKRKALGVIRIVAQRIYGMSQPKTFELIDEAFCLKFGIDFKGGV